MRFYCAVFAILTCILTVDAMPTSTDEIQEFPASVSLAKYQECINAKNGSNTENVVCQDLDTMQLELDKINIPRTIVRFQKFVATLKSYVSTTGFDVSRFDYDRNSLNKKLSELTHASMKYPGVDDIREFCEFATDLYSKLAESARFIKCYTYVRFKGHHLVLKLVELNVKLFTMQDPKGYIEKSLSSIKDLFLNDFSNLASWKAELDALDDPPLLIKIMFNDQLHKARHSIEALMETCEGLSQNFLRPEHFSSFFGEI